MAARRRFSPAWLGLAVCVALGLAVGNWLLFGPRPLNQEASKAHAAKRWNIQITADARVVGDYEWSLGWYSFVRLEIPRSELAEFRRHLPDKIGWRSEEEKHQWMSLQTLPGHADWWRPDLVKKCEVGEWGGNGDLYVIMIGEDDPNWATIYLSAS